MKESISLRKRFCKDYNLPINLYDSPYFEQRLQTLDTQFNCVILYKDYMEEVSQFVNEEEYFAEYNRVKDATIQFIRNHPRYDEFTNSKVHSTCREYPRKELYSDCNDGKTFFSIDMRKANFTTIRKLYPHLVDYSNSWETFMSKFTNIEHIINSKYIRQVIMGACCPKKQVQWEKFLMESIALGIEHSLNLCHIISVSTDEILIESESPCSMSTIDLISIIDKAWADFKLVDMVKVSKFRLKKIDGFGWVKQFIHEGSTDGLSDKYEFKCVEADKYHILMKLYNNEELTDDDLVFRHDGLLARYLDKEQFKLS
jgi:hypothetical protein